MYYVYLLRCRDGSLYTGVTTDPARRFRQHAGMEPGGARYTASRKAAAYAAVWEVGEKGDALHTEARLKRLTHAQKEALAAGAAAYDGLFPPGSHRVEPPESSLPDQDMNQARP